MRCAAVNLSSSHSKRACARLDAIMLALVGAPPLRLVRCCSSGDGPGATEPPAPAGPSAADKLRARMAAAKTYKEQQQQLGQSYIVQAAATLETASSASGVRPEVQAQERENARPEVEFITRESGYSPKTTSWGGER